MTSLNKDEEWIEESAKAIMLFTERNNRNIWAGYIKSLLHKLAHKIKEDTQKEVVENLIEALKAEYGGDFLGDGYRVGLALKKFTQSEEDLSAK